MPSFFSSSKTTSKKCTPVFAGLDDPFNFPTSKMRYNSHSILRTSSPDSGYGSIDDDSPLSPKAEISSKNRRRLQKDGKGHWRMQSYEHQSEGNDHTAEKEPMLGNGRPEADDKHTWKPDPKRTFTAICNDQPPKPKWYSSRIYGRALERMEKSEGLTELQRSMAPVLRRASPAIRTEWKGGEGAQAGGRKGSTLLHPSPPPAPTHVTKTSNTEVSEQRVRSAETARGRKPSTLLHPSPPPSPSSNPTRTELPATVPPTMLSLRSPRHRSPTPLGIPTSSEKQPAPTPLRIHLRKPSVLHSCFSDAESDVASTSDDDGEWSEGGSEQGDGHGDAIECSDVKSIESAVGEKNGVILATTALVARAQRVRVRSPGLKKSVEVVG